MGKLNSPKRRSLDRQDFEQYSVWTWDDEDESDLVPISEPNPSPEDYWGSLLVKAVFKTESGHIFDGNIVGGRSFYAFGIFLGDDEFLFNVHLPDFNRKILEKLCKVSNLNIFQLFPLLYASPVRYRDGMEICGIINYSDIIHERKLFD